MGIERKDEKAEAQAAAIREDEARRVAAEQAEQARNDRAEKAAVVAAEGEAADNPALDQKRRNINIDVVDLPKDISVQRVDSSEANWITCATGEYNMADGPVQVDSITADLLVDTGEAEVVSA